MTKWGFSPKSPRGWSAWRRVCGERHVRVSAWPIFYLYIHTCYHIPFWRSFKKWRHCCYGFLSVSAPCEETEGVSVYLCWLLYVGWIGLVHPSGRLGCDVICKGRRKGVLDEAGCRALYILASLFLRERKFRPEHNMLRTHPEATSTDLPGLHTFVMCR